jgi:hypothetical protein
MFIEFIETSSIGGTAGEPNPEGSPELSGGGVVDDGAFSVDDEELEDCELSLSCLLVAMRGE